MYGDLKNHLSTQLKDIQDAGLFKRERIITTAQDAVIKTTDGEEVLNFCSNNYLGLSSHPRVLEAAHRTLRYAWFWDELCAFYLRDAGHT